MRTVCAVLVAALTGACATETPIDAPIDAPTVEPPSTLTAAEREAAYDDADPVLKAQRAEAARARARIIAEAEAIEKADEIANAEADAFNQAELVRVRRERYEWLRHPGNRPIMVRLCSLPKSLERIREFVKARSYYGIVPKRSKAADAMAEAEGLAVFDCASFVTNRPKSKT